MQMTTTAPSRGEDLRAGPIHVKFADGELRYLYVGDKEIVRRIYFAVRNGSWATSTPVFTRMEVHQALDSFTVDLAARCDTDGVDYGWTGRIVGTADGRITFHATGVSGAAFSSNRIGLCVLYGAPSLAGQVYETAQEGGTPRPGRFPELVSAALVTGQFNRLRYTGEHGLTVTTAVSGTRFDMEDQRTYGDSSFKAYAPLSYPYPAIPAHAAAAETVTVQVEHAPRVVPSERLTIRVGGQTAARVPRIVIRPATNRGGTFGEVNGRAEQFRGAREISWPYTPSIHLLDDDVFFENVWALPDQVKSAHAYAPGADIAIDPIVLDSRPGPEGDRRNAGEFGAAWSLALIKELSIAGVSNARFAMGPGKGEAIQREIAGYGGRPLREVGLTHGPQPPPVDALAIDGVSGPVVYVYNRTGRSQTTDVVGANGHRQTVALPPYGFRRLSDVE